VGGGWWVAGKETGGVRSGSAPRPRLPFTRTSASISCTHGPNELRRLTCDFCGTGPLYYVEGAHFPDTCEHASAAEGGGWRVYRREAGRRRPGHWETKAPMKRLIVWATLAGIELMASGAARAAGALLGMDLTGSISSLGATQIAHIFLPLRGRTNVGGRLVQTPAGESLGTEFTLSRPGVPACRPPPLKLRRPAETPALLAMPP
jgi:hypothetical protein